MGELQTLALGAIAGGTILLGMPLARVRAPLGRLRPTLCAVAIGILVFLVWDVLTSAFAPIDAALARLREHGGGAWPVAGYSALFFGGLAVGLCSLAYYERALARRRRRDGPGAMAASPALSAAGTADAATGARQLSVLIAAGVGMHNFGEGLAIGASAARGAVALATLLVIGFALHNATEGFGIVAPLTAEAERPSWRLLLALGLIGGGPTFVGTAIGRQSANEALAVAFLALAAGSMLDVVRRALSRELLVWGVLLGIVAGFVTDMVVTAAGA